MNFVYHRLSILFILVIISAIALYGCSSCENKNAESNPDNFKYEKEIFTDLPNDAVPFCENKIPLSSYYMIMCEEPSEPIGYSAYLKDIDGTFIKINLLIPDDLIYDSAKLLAMPSGGGGSGEDTLYMEFIISGEAHYYFFTTDFGDEYWWNYRCQGESYHTSEEIQNEINEHERIKKQINSKNK